MIVMRSEIPTVYKNLTLEMSAIAEVMWTS